jgi:hypothetical protein
MTPSLARLAILDIMISHSLLVLLTAFKRKWVDRVKNSLKYALGIVKLLIWTDTPDPEGSRGQRLYCAGTAAGKGKGIVEKLNAWK